MSLANVDTLISFALVMLLLSLLVTTLVETANLLLNSRGRNLLWGVGEVLSKLGVGTDRSAKAALDVLTHEALAPDLRGMFKWFEGLFHRVLDWITGSNTTGAVRRVATAIRFEEFARVTIDVLKDELPANARAGLAAAIVVPARAPGAEQLAAEPALLSTVARAAVEAAAPLLANVATAAGEAKAKAEQQIIAVLEQGLHDATQPVRQAAAEAEAWFQMVMDRTTERFVAHTRTVTVVIAALLCVVFQIDSLHILERLSADPALRDSLVRVATEQVAQREDVQKTLDKGRSLASDTLLSLQLDPADKKLLPARIDPPLADQAHAEVWLRDNVKDEAARARISQAFVPALGQRERERATELAATREKLVVSLQASGLDLLTPGKSWWPLNGRCIVGVLMSFLFLSLGAPFWFNTLRNLSNLRPIVAGKVEPETK